MKRLFSLSLIVFLATVGESHATSITFSASGGRVVQDASGVQIANGDLVWVGTFANTSFSFNPSLSIATNIANIESGGGWNQFTLDSSTSQPDSGVSNSVTIGGLAGGGRVLGTITDNNSGATKADFFNGKTVYLWVFNASSLGAATQMGIFTATVASPNSWIFPNNANGVNDGTSLLIDSSSTMVAVGSVPVGSVTSTNLILVPEPSTWAALIGGVGFVSMLRRRRSAQS